MPHSLIWLPHVLKAAGLKVALVDGWEDRGRGDVGNIFGVICHHTATPSGGNMPTLKTLLNGRSDLPGPLSQLGLGRDGTYYILAAGRSNHAGKGIWKGLTNGNTNFIGIEAENTGRASDFPWPRIQMEAYQRGVAAILKHVGQSEEFCCAHREFARPAGRKNDPAFNMNEFRLAVGAFMRGEGPEIVRIPQSETPATGSSTPGRPTLRRGAEGEFVKQLQTKIRLTADGKFGPGTEAALRTFQRSCNMVPDGICGPKTWIELDKARV